MLRLRRPQALYEKARRLETLGRPAPAAVLYERAAEAGHGPACNAWGKHLLRAGQTIEGLKWIRQAVDARIRGGAAATRVTIDALDALLGIRLAP